MAIQKLSPLMVSQIAAGEVIERPASVVKELVENCLDAGASRVDITIEDGGRELIRVADNGAGIAPDELHLAVTPHATSKLSCPEQLAAISTLGFRGEALASLASVSRLRITSRSSPDGLTAEAGATLEASGDQMSKPVPVGCAAGTIVEVRDLFFNTPARRKFMRAAPTEFGHISDLVMRISMIHHQVSFQLNHGSRKILDVPANHSRRQRCVHLLGHELDEALLMFDATQPPVQPNTNTPQHQIKVWGLAGLPAIARATSKFQYLVVNNRPIRDRNIAHAVKEAYRGLIPPNRYPVAVVMIDIDPHEIDVNVHPAKSEVRFHDAQKMHHLVMAGLRQCLLEGDLTPSATVSYVAPIHNPGPKQRRLEPSPRAESAVTTSTSVSNVTPSNEVQPTITPFYQPPTPARGFDLEHVKQSLINQNESPPETSNNQPDHNITKDRCRLSTEPPITPTVLQVHNSYLVTQDEQGLIIVDQHALHERVMFEDLRRRLLDDSGQTAKNLESQRLLMPAILKASPQRLALLDQLKPLTDRIGIEADSMGPDTLAIHAFPSFLFDRNVDPIQFVEELLDRALEGDLDPLPIEKKQPQNSPTVHIQEAVLHKVLDMMACKAAVKAGDKLGQQEMNALLEKRDEIERSSSCPHGRPTTIRLTLREMEKQFKRR